MDRLVFWREWREACALARIGETARAELTEFLGARFYSVARRLRRPEVLQRLPDAAGRAGLFETWCALHPETAGKRYKDWLLTRGDQRLGAVESGVSLMMRKVVAEWVRMEFARHPALSLDAPLGGEGDLSLEQLLPAPRVQRVDAETQTRVREQLTAWVAGLSSVRRVAICARAHGLVFSDPRVTRTAGVGKSALYEQYRQCLAELVEGLRVWAPELEASALQDLTLDVLHEAEKMIFSEFFVEKSGTGACEG